MARNTQFLELVTMLKDELGRSSKVGVGVDDLSGLKRRINRVYATLYEKHDWPHLRFTPRVTLNQGQRYYDPPASMNIERIEKIDIFWSGSSHKAHKGISSREYNTFDSDLDERNEPAMRWDLRFNDPKAQIEVWPIPSTNAQSMEITGIRSAPKLVDDIDLCLLDDEVVVGLAAAPLLKRQGSKDWDVVLAEANSRLGDLLKNMETPSRPIRMGLPDAGQTPAGRAIVQISS